MQAEELSWINLDIHAAHADWVCTKSHSRPVDLTVDGIDYFLEFTAIRKKLPGVPDTRQLQLRTSEFLVATDLPFVKLVIEGQILDGAPWDRFKEVYKRD